MILSQAELAQIYNDVIVDFSGKVPNNINAAVYAKLVPAIIDVFNLHHIFIDVQYRLARTGDRTIRCYPKCETHVINIYTTFRFAHGWVVGASVLSMDPGFGSNRYGPSSLIITKEGLIICSFQTDGNGITDVATYVNSSDFYGDDDMAIQLILKFS